MDTYVCADWFGEPQMYAFLFDEDHPSMPGLFGPTCASKVIAVLDGIAETHLLVGSLLHSNFAYGIEELTYSPREDSDPPRRGGSSSQKMVGSRERFTTVICDLAETLAGDHPLMTEEDLLGVLGRKQIWTVVASNISRQHAELADRNCRQFDPYIGCVSTNSANPVHRRLFIDYLFKTKYLSSQGLLFQRDDGGFEETCAEYGARKFEVLDIEEYARRVPSLAVSEVTSERGSISAQRALGGPASYREKVADGLLQNKDYPREFRFSVTSALGAAELVADERKFRGYLLDESHPKGGGKARFFRDVLGIIPDDWRYLADQLVQGAAAANLHRVSVTNWEYGHGAIVRVTGRNGREALVETGWKVQDDGPGSLITAYPYEGEDRPDIQPVISRVPDLRLTGDALQEAIYELAKIHGEKAGNAATPTPMVLQKWGTIWDGKCGFAWTHVLSAKTPFGRWLSRKQIGYPNRPGRLVFSRLSTQSIDKHIAYANAFAGVLLINGIECKVDSRLD